MVPLAWCLWVVGVVADWAWWRRWFLRGRWKDWANSEIMWKPVCGVILSCPFSLPEAGGLRGVELVDLDSSEWLEV